MTLSNVHRKLKSNDSISFTREYLSQLSIRGVIPHAKDGKKKIYDYNTVYQALFINGYIRDSSLPAVKTTITGNEKLKLSSNSTFNDAKLYLTFYKGKLANQEFDLKAGLLMYRKDVEQKAFNTTRILRDQILTLPERFAGELSSEESPELIEQLLYKEITRILESFTPESLIP